MSDFKRCYRFSNKNGFEAKVWVPEDLYQERCVPFLRARDNEGFENALKELILDAMGIPKITTWAQEQEYLTFQAEVEDIPIELLSREWR